MNSLPLISAADSRLFSARKTVVPIGAEILYTQIKISSRAIGLKAAQLHAPVIDQKGFIISGSDLPPVSAAEHEMIIIVFKKSVYRRNITDTGLFPYGIKIHMFRLGDVVSVLILKSSARFLSPARLIMIRAFIKFTHSCFNVTAPGFIFFTCIGIMISNIGKLMPDDGI